MGVIVFIVIIIEMSDDLGRDPRTTTGTEDVVFSFWAVVIIKLYIPDDILEQNVNKRGEGYHSCFLKHSYTEMETHTFVCTNTLGGIDPLWD